MTPADTPPPAAASLGLPGLVLGALLIGFAAIIVRLVEVGPTAAAFWRLALALPLIALLAESEPVVPPRPSCRPAPPCA